MKTGRGLMEFESHRTLTSIYALDIMSVPLIKEANVIFRCFDAIRHTENVFENKRQPFNGEGLGESELLRNNRHHRVRTSIAEVLRHLGWEVHEEVHCISAADSNRRADIIAIGRVKDKAMVSDPTIRFERNLSQVDEVNKEKQEIYELCLPFLSFKYNIPVNQWVVKAPDVCREIKARRVRWLGHICRKDENDPCKKLTLTIPFGTRKVGRPQLRWLDEVEKDIIAAGVRMENKGVRSKDMEKHRWGGQGWNPAVEPKKEKKKNLFPVELML
ncbi:hypothetical protein ANN_13285 [Periplaneta americana]|uniref:Uncharacterized protein n=1 Tax=Periplaneta americana TaxID=6978 RepID=A0ABQ8TJZ7_PERAM|nr:hypothetical protein ANN_13285 [Periplaneta americana]